jgi:poly(glycerol-phosphate) alpha-glucosyltransferase
MKVSVLTGSVSRQAGGTFDAIRRPAAIMAEKCCASIQVLGTADQDTDADLSGWMPLKPETFNITGPRSFGYASGMAGALEQFQPQLQHVHGLWMYCSCVNLRYSKQQQTPYIISPHGMLDPWAIQNSAWKKRVAGMAFERRHLDRASCLHALCTSEVVAFRDFGLKNPVCVIPNGVDLPQRQGYAAPWAEQPASGKKILLYLGRLHPKKGLVNLLHAWKQFVGMDARTSTWVLALAGWDQEGHESELRNLVEELGLGYSVMFLGPQFAAGKQACYENADAYILPSFSEGLPMTVLEAWAYGLPVVMTPQCNIPEGFSENAAIKVEPNPADIAEGLRKLVSLSDTERKEMGCCGLSLVKKNFTWGKVAEEMYTVYQWLAGNGSLPSSVSFAE